jgi:hypothetical protein
MLLLRREFDRAQDAFRCQMDERFRAQEQAVRTFSDTNQRALEKVNEFRASMDDQTRRFATGEALKGVQARVEEMVHGIEGKFENGAQNRDRRIGDIERNFAAHLGEDKQAHASNRNLVLWMGLVLAVIEIAARYMWR